MNISEKCRNIRLLLTDVDGVLTDGKLHYTSEGEFMKSFNVKDGLVTKRLIQAGINVGIVTGRSSGIVATRAKELGIEIVHQGQGDKISTLAMIAKSHHLAYNEIAYIGDDLNDLDVIKNVGFSGCPSDAVTEVKDCVDYVCGKAGGDAAFREFADMILANKGN
jgi:3-deoxy-D-manno-octulosonate 8-phosphate phosphatase (KDO 8-P phosphatase)